MNKPTLPQPKGIAGEFQRFLTKTNAIALAIGIIIGGAATKLVSALVDDLINPLIGAVTGNVDSVNLKIVLAQRKPLTERPCKTQSCTAVSSARSLTLSSSWRSSLF
jgi:large-conductance mechanosensitive channel